MNKITGVFLFVFFSLLMGLLIKVQQEYGQVIAENRKLNARIVNIECNMVSQESIMPYITMVEALTSREAERIMEEEGLITEEDVRQYLSEIEFEDNSNGQLGGLIPKMLNPPLKQVF